MAPYDLVTVPNFKITRFVLIGLKVQKNNRILKNINEIQTYAYFTIFTDF